MPATAERCEREQQQNAALQVVLEGASSGCLQVLQVHTPSHAIFLPHDDCTCCLSVYSDTNQAHEEDSSNYLFRSDTLTVCI